MPSDDAKDSVDIETPRDLFCEDRSSGGSGYVCCRCRRDFLFAGFVVVLVIVNFRVLEFTFAFVRIKEAGFLVGVGIEGNAKGDD